MLLANIDNERIKAATTATIVSVLPFTIPVLFISSKVPKAHKAESTIPKTAGCTILTAITTANSNPATTPEIILVFKIFTLYNLYTAETTISISKVHYRAVKVLRFKVGP